MKLDIRAIPPSDDSGTEGIIGYDYQRDFALKLVIEMLGDKDVEFVVCEFHQDLVTIARMGSVRLVQVKKRDTGTWTLNDLVSTRGKKQSVLANLFTPLQNGKNVSSLALWGFGRMGRPKQNNALHISEFLHLHKTPRDHRDDNWYARYKRYEEYFAEQLQSQSLTTETIQQALALLDIRFDEPSPNIIEYQCYELMNTVLRRIFDVQLDPNQIKTICNDLLARINRILKKPNLAWDSKAVSRSEVLEIVISRLRQYHPSLGHDFSMNLQDKLTSVGLGEKAPNALQKRLDAMALRFEIGIDSATWEEYKTAIGLSCSTFREDNPGVRGLALWIQMLSIFSEVSKPWSAKDSRLDRAFAEGVFFDMTGICEARWLRTGM